MTRMDLGVHLSKGRGGGGPIEPVLTSQAYSTPATGFPGSGSPTRITVPAGMTFMRMHLIGGAGGAGVYGGAVYSGPGGYSKGTLAVTPGEQFDVYVGQGGQGGRQSPSSGGYGGWPNGGHGTFGDTWGGGGGGRTEVRRVSDSASILIAGGGGGNNAYWGVGGSGGGLTGAPGGGPNDGSIGLGGTQSAGGGGTAGKYQGGFNNSGGEASYPFGNTDRDSGGGGDGWYGGGPGTSDGRPAGGGSGYMNPELTAASTTQSDSVSTRHSSVPATLYGHNTGTAGNSKPGLTSGNALPGDNGLAIIAFSNVNDFAA